MEQQEPQLILCPYCGDAQPPSERCANCGGLFEPLSRKATQISMGPWYLRDKNQPFLPGCSYDILLRHIKAGRIKPTTIMRGPTTHQFWAIARNVPGIAHLLGYCHQCNVHVEPTAPRCPSCGAPFEAVRQRNELGLIYPDDKSVALGQMRLEWEQAQRTGRFPNPVTSIGTGGGPGGAGGVAAGAPLPIPSEHGGERAAATPGRGNPVDAVGLDLLEEVLGTSPATTPGARRGPSAPYSRPASQIPPRQGSATPKAPVMPMPGRAIMETDAQAQRSADSSPPLPPPTTSNRSPLLDFGAEAAAGASGSVASGRRPAARPAIDSSNIAGGVTESAPDLDLDGGGRRLTTTFWLLASVTFLIILGVAVLVAIMLRGSIQLSK